jgi:hypothetical protein
MILLFLFLFFPHFEGNIKNFEINWSQGRHFAGKVVYGAMIHTDPKIASVLGRDFHKVPQGVNGSAVENAQLRFESGRKMVQELPFPVQLWWSVYAAPCPGRRLNL